MTKLKRFEPRQLFERLAHFGQRWPAVCGESGTQTRFLVIPRFNACIQASASSVDFFFSHVHRVNTLRTRTFRYILKAACLSRGGRRLLIKTGIVSQVVNAAPYQGIEWAKIDVLFAEWHFVGAFSRKRMEVAHVLGFPAFKEKLEHEIEARTLLRATIGFPELKGSFVEDPAGWVEEIVGGGGGQLTTARDYHRAQKNMLAAYRKTARKVRPSAYVRQLMTRAKDKYERDEYDVLPLLHDLERRAQSLLHHSDVSHLTLAYSHGDLKPSQVLREKGKVYIIDWTESGCTWVLHDLASLLMEVYDTFSLSRTDDVPDELEPLFEGVCTELASVPGDLSFVITLIEIAVRQHVVFKDGRGPIKRWKRDADVVLQGKAMP